MKYSMQILVALILMTVATVSRGDWIYWTVDFSDDTGVTPPWSEEEAPSTIWLTARSSEGEAVTLASYYNSGKSYASKDFSNPEKGWSYKDYFFQSDLASLGQFSAADMTYFVEIGDTIGSAAWVSEGISLDGLKALGAVTAGTASSGDMASYWAPSTWAVPEPTSGLLMLVGMGLLALRRRRA